MITKKVNRYYCEFCKKGGQNAGVIRKHECSCTRNPKRACAMCGSYNWDYHSLVVLLGIHGVSAVSDQVDGCPACVLAVIQQREMEVGDGKNWEEFDYEKEKEAWYQEKNEREARADAGSYWP